MDTRSKAAFLNADTTVLVQAWSNLDLARRPVAGLADDAPETSRHRMGEGDGYPGDEADLESAAGHSEPPPPGMMHVD